MPCLRIIHPHLHTTIMFNKNFIALIICLLLQVISLPGYAQVEETKSRGEYSLVIMTGGGASYYLISPGVPRFLETTITRISPSATFRVMWFPDHRLRVGIESGWTDLYSYKIKGDYYSGKLKLSSIPILIVWSMLIDKNINLYGGTGTFYNYTTLYYAGKSVSGNFNLGWMLAASYNINLNDKLTITPELKWLDISESKDQSLSLQLLLAWKVFKW
jgi:hypothetical protein